MKKKADTTKKMSGKVVKFSLIKSAVKSDMGTIFYFTPKGDERFLAVGDKVTFTANESNDLNKCSDVKKG